MSSLFGGTVIADTSHLLDPGSDDDLAQYFVNFDDLIVPGLSPAQTVTRFVIGCKQSPRRLFITESWFAPFRARLLAALPPALTEPLAEALLDAIHKRRRLEIVVEFIEEQPTTWPKYERRRAARDRAAEIEGALRGFFPWKDVEACRSDGELQRSARASQAREPVGRLGRSARACPGCGRSALDLAWIYFRSPEWTWTQMCGREGWMAICDACHMQVNFLLNRMN